MSLGKQILCAQVPKAVTYWQSMTRFPEFSVSKISPVMLTLLFRMAFELCHHGRSRQEGNFMLTRISKCPKCKYETFALCILHLEQRDWGLGYISSVAFHCTMCWFAQYMHANRHNTIAHWAVVDWLRAWPNVINHRTTTRKVQSPLWSTTDLGGAAGQRCKYLPSTC